MKFSIITPFNRGLENLRDNLESIKEQRLRIYLDEVDGAPGFTRTDRLMNLRGAENIDKIVALVKSGDLEGVEALANIKGLDDLWPSLTFDGLGNIVKVTEKSDLAVSSHSSVVDAGSEEEREEKGRRAELRQRVRHAELVLQHDAHRSGEVQEELNHGKEHEHRRNDESPALHPVRVAHVPILLLANDPELRPARLFPQACRRERSELRTIGASRR